MKLKVKFLEWNAGVPVAMLDKDTAKKLGVHTEGRISIKTMSKHPKEISSVTNNIEGPVNENQILVSAEIKKRLNLKRGQSVDVNLADPPHSLSYIKEKLNGKKLPRKKIDEIISDIVDNSLSEAEVAMFVSAMYKEGMTNKETIYLIDSIIKYGNRLKLRSKNVVDKHSIGGVSGNRTTPLVVSICAAAGLVFPKTSSRAITSPAGTADVIETIADVEFKIAELKKILKKTNAFMVWGGSLGMVPADSRIIKIEKMLKIDPKSQLLASIMSKKFAVGSRYILIDIPYGKSAKVSKKKAEELKKEFLALAKHFNKKMEVLLTDGSQPIGNGIGPVLELMDILKILDPEKQGPKDLEKKSLLLASTLLELSGKAKKGKGMELAEKTLYSGKAYEKFKEIIKAQNGSIKRLKCAKFSRRILTKKNCTIKEINNKKISAMARIAGCPVDKASGIYLHNHVGEKIKKGKPIVTVYAETESRLRSAVRYFNDKKPVKMK